MDSRYLVKFCEQLQKLVDELERIFPNENDFAVLGAAILWLGESDKKRLAREYKTHVFIYRELLDAEDIAGILAIDPLDHIKKEYKEVKDTEGHIKIDHFKKLLNSEATPETKKNIFAYLKIINKLMDGILMEGKVNL